MLFAPSSSVPVNSQLKTLLRRITKNHGQNGHGTDGNRQINIKMKKGTSTVNDGNANPSNNKLTGMPTYHSICPAI